MSAGLRDFGFGLKLQAIQKRAIRIASLNQFSFKNFFININPAARRAEAPMEVSLHNIEDALNDGVDIFNVFSTISEA